MQIKEYANEESMQNTMFEKFFLKKLKNIPCTYVKESYFSNIFSILIARDNVLTWFKALP